MSKTKKTKEEYKEIKDLQNNLVEEIFNNKANFKRYDDVLICDTYDFPFRIRLDNIPDRKGLIDHPNMVETIFMINNDLDEITPKLEKILELSVEYCFNKMINNKESSVVYVHSLDLKYLKPKTGKIGVEITTVSYDYFIKFIILVNDNGYYNCSKEIFKRDPYKTIEKIYYKDNNNFFNDIKFPFGFEESLKEYIIPIQARLSYEEYQEYIKNNKDVNTEFKFS